MTLQKRPPLASGMLGLYRGDSGIIADYSNNGDSNGNHTMAM